MLADSICGCLHVVVYELRDVGCTRGKVRFLILAVSCIPWNNYMTTGWWMAIML